MFHRRYAVPFLVAITASACWAVPSSQPASEPSTRPARLAYGFKTGEDVVYNLKIVYEYPDETIDMSGYSIYHVKSANSVGYVSFTHSTKLGKVPDPEERATIRTVNGQPEVKRYFVGDCSGVFNAQGNLMDLRKNEPLPCSLGESAYLMLPPLPVGDESSWEHRFEYTRVDSNRGYGAFGPGFMPPPIPMIGPRFPMGPGMGPGMGQGRSSRGDQDRFNYDEVWRYSLGEETGETVVINASCQLTLDKLNLAVQGPLVWNLRTGRVQSLELKYRWTWREGEQELIIPVTVTAALASGEDAKKFVEEQQQRKQDDEQAFKAATQRAVSESARMSREMAMHQGRPGMDSKDLTSDEVGLLLQDLKARATHTVMQACDRLAATKPLPERRQEVIAAIKPLLVERDIFIRRSAVSAYGTWGAPADVQGIKDALVDEDDTFARDALREAMRKIQARAESRPAPESPASAPAQ